MINTVTAFAYMFTYIYTITNGGPGFDTYTSEFYIYRRRSPSRISATPRRWDS